MNNIQQHIETLRDALGNVTPGQWNAEGFEVWRRGTKYNDTEDRHIMICDVFNLANAGLVANSPTWHQQSIDLLEQQQREIAEHKRQSDEWADGCDELRSQIEIKELRLADKDREIERLKQVDERECKFTLELKAEIESLRMQRESLESQLQHYRGYQ